MFDDGVSVIIRYTNFWIGYENVVSIGVVLLLIIYSYPASMFEVVSR
jgi:hypothetical protein